MERPRLRDNKGKAPFELYPIGQIPEDIIVGIAKWMAYSFTIGKSDIDGEDWGDIFARALEGEHLGKPVGLADVVYNGMAWSVKSVKSTRPHHQSKIRLISGRCSPDYSYGITDPHADVQHTGTAVLSIWNERVNIAKEKFEPLRTSILIRNFTSLEFALFEHEVVRFITSDYVWRVNRNGNIEGYKATTNAHRFTWQPHGSQFTILMDVPPSVCKFKIKRPAVLDFDKTMAQIGFDPNWVTIM